VAVPGSVGSAETQSGSLRNHGTIPASTSDRPAAVVPALPALSEDEDLAKVRGNPSGRRMVVLSGRAACTERSAKGLAGRQLSDGLLVVVGAGAWGDPEWLDAAPPLPQHPVLRARPPRAADAERQRRRASVRIELLPAATAQGSDG
jgi:hypothetical protein